MLIEKIVLTPEEGRLTVQIKGGAYPGADEGRVLS